LIRKVGKEKNNVRKFLFIIIEDLIFQQFGGSIPIFEDLSSNSCGV
jgi:hypothetical protein